MMTPALFAAALALSPMQSAPQTPTRPAPAPDAEARAPAPRMVCRFETVTGSNRRTRVCRAPAAPGAQDQATRDMMRDMQRARMPDAG